MSACPCVGKRIAEAQHPATTHAAAELYARSKREACLGEIVATAERGSSGAKQTRRWLGSRHTRDHGDGQYRGQEQEAGHGSEAGIK
jgi:hypothetical protein